MNTFGAKKAIKKHMSFEERSCLTKRRYESRQDCEASFALHPKEGLQLRAYKCQFCKCWHKTKQSLK